MSSTAAEPGSAERPERLDPTPPALLYLVAGVIVTVTAAAGIAFLVFTYAMSTYQIEPFEAARTAVTLIGVPTAAGAVFVALRNLRLKEQQLHTDRQRLVDAQRTYDLAFNTEHTRRDIDRENQLRARYVTAADQIGNDSVLVRLAGVNAMAQLADEWEAKREACVDVLAAYLRLPQRRTPHVDELDAADGEVRLTVQRLIAEGFKNKKVAGGSKWPGMTLNLRGAVLHDFRMPHTNLERALFRGTKFTGSTTFIGSTFRDADFVSAAFEGPITFSSCIFTRVNFARTTFNKDVRFKRTSFTGMISFASAKFLGNLILDEAESKRPIAFSKTEFSRHPVREAKGYKVTIKDSFINGDPIANYNVGSKPVFDTDGEDDELEDLTTT
jgi:hypothetical protein